MKKPLRLAKGKIAALFIDLQEEHRGDRRYLVEGFDAILDNVIRLQETARRNAVPVYHFAYIVDIEREDVQPFHPVQADGKSVFSDKSDPLAAICSEVGPVGDEQFLVKSRASAFGVEKLAAEFRASGIEWLVIAGVWTEACIDATVKDAVGLGFHVLLVKDACGSGTAAMHQSGILNLANRLYGGAIVDTQAACLLLEGHTSDAWQVHGAVPLRYTFTDAEKLYAAL